MVLPSVFHQRVVEAGAADDVDHLDELVGLVRDPFVSRALNDR
jgi:hypothetical protein